MTGIGDLSQPEGVPEIAEPAPVEELRPTVRRRGSLPLLAYFLLLAALFVAAAAAGAIHVHTQMARDSRHAAEQDAAFAAKTAGKQLGASIALLHTSVASLAANPQIGSAIDHPAGCTLNYGGIVGGPADRSHLDLLRTDGTVVCSSRRSAGARTTAYVGMDWVRRAAAAPILLAPVLDGATGARVAIEAVPVPGHGIVVGMADLTAVGPGMASLYGGGRPAEFLLTTGNRRTVLARSIDSAKWVGASLKGTAFAGDVRSVDRRDLDGTPRLYEEAAVPGLPWRLFVGEDKASALAAGQRLERRQLEIILVGLTALLLAALLAYRRVARPIARLGAAVRASGKQTPRALVPLVGPTEVTGLANDINGLISSVDRELLERLRSEAALRESEALSRAMLDSSLDAVVTIDEDGAIVEFNPAAEQIFGRSRSEVLGQQMPELLIPPSLRDAHHRGFERFLATGDGPILGKRLQLTALRADGSEFPVELAINKVASDGPILFTGYLRDVSEQRQLEQQQRQSQKMEAVGQLAGGIAHDFNNLLALIEITNHTMRKAGASEDRLNTVAQAVERGSGLTRQLLAFAKRQPLEPQPLEPNEIVTELIDLVKPLLGSQVSLNVALDPDAGAILADRAQIEQVLMNLIVNARDAMPDGGELSIETGNRDLDESYAPYEPNLKAGSYVMFAVSDTGTGMDEATRARLFEPFYSTKGDQGSGLGLATAYGIVQQAGGFIWVYSQLGYGTSFKVYLPRTQATEITPMVPVANGERILVVEDDPQIGVAVVRILAEGGYDAQLASTRDEALAATSEDGAPFAAVLCDVMVGSTSGPAIVDALRRSHPALSVLYMSGYAPRGADEHDAVTLDERSEFIGKPFSADLLLGRLQGLLGRAV